MRAEKPHHVGFGAVDDVVARGGGEFLGHVVTITGAYQKGKGEEKLGKQKREYDY